MKSKFRKGDRVIVTHTIFKGKTGTILQVYERIFKGDEQIYRVKLDDVKISQDISEEILKGAR